MSYSNSALLNLAGESFWGRWGVESWTSFTADLSVLESGIDFLLGSTSLAFLLILSESVSRSRMSGERDFFVAFTDVRIDRPFIPLARPLLCPLESGCWVVVVGKPSLKCDDVWFLLWLAVGGPLAMSRGSERCRFKGGCWNNYQIG